MNKPFFSIIVTTFNNDKTIEKTLNSVINQTLNNDLYEIIVIDDKSTDDTFNKLQTFNANNLTIHQLELNSGGPSAPRNLGIQLSHGHYIYFLDGDDWLDLNILEKIANKYVIYDTNLIIAKVIKYKDGNTTVHAKFMTIDEHIDKPGSDIPYLYYYMGPSGKFIKRSLIIENNIQFPLNLHFGEDKLFFMTAFVNAHHVTTTPIVANYLNRSTDNVSIVKKSDFLTKRESDYIIFKSALNISDKKIRDKFLLRIVEYDLFNNCNSKGFINLNFTQKISVFDIIKKICTHPYIRDYIIPNVAHKYDDVINAIYHDDVDKFNAFFAWYNSGAKLLTKPNQQHYSLISVDDYRFEVRDPLATTKNLQQVQKSVYLQLAIHNLSELSISGIQLASRSNFMHSIFLSDYSINHDLLTIKLPETILNDLSKGIYNVFVIYDNYKPLNIRYAYNKNMTLPSNDITFYPTINGFLSMKVK